MPEQKLRGEFLEEFVRNLISNSCKPEKVEEKIAEEKLEPKVEKPVKMIPSIMHKPMQRPMPVQRIPAHNMVPLPEPQQGKFGEELSFGKISSLLKDPSVFSVECPGPGKNVLVNRAGTIQTAPMILSKEEIDKIMQEVSEKTRIPLISGVFKAAIQDVLMTAVISDFVGTRFMIQKRMPGQRY